MPDERESSFKVTDRRKFNADGSPRDPSAEPEVVAVVTEIIEPQPTAAEASTASAASVVSNVVSFPGEGTRGRETSEASSPSPVLGHAPDPAPADASQSSNATAQQSAAEHAFSKAAGPRPAGVPEASFLDLLDMLAVQAALHLGMMPSETPEKLPIDLPLARHFIDMLAVVQAKTRGNLNGEEESSVESALAELRMRYVELSRS